MKATANIYLDGRLKMNGECTVKIKITHNRKRKYYTTDISVLPDEYEKLMYAKRRTRSQNEIYNKLLYYKSKANDVIDKLDVFTFSKFEEAYLEKRDVNKNVVHAFYKYIKRLKEKGKIGTAITYECSRNSLDSYRKNLEFADITPSFLEDYETWMTTNGKSITTVSMYLRCLRATFNRQSIDKSIYPFGAGSNKYSIPSAKNIKKALTIAEIKKIFNYKTESGSTTEMAKDYWIFMYLSNGMNVKDLCFLKWENIENDFIIYQRSKTSSSKKDRQFIEVSLKPETLKIINKWGVRSFSEDAFIFPHLKPNLTPERQRRIYNDLTKLINKYIKRIAKDVGINKNVTTYYARHSFATVLKRSGANTEMISELLGHSSVEVTKNYLDSFEKEQIKKQTDVLTSGFNKAN